MENKALFKYIGSIKEHQIECTSLRFIEIKKNSQEACVNTCSKCDNDGMESSSYSILYWIRATTETIYEVGGL